MVDTCSNAATFDIVSRLDEDKAFGSKTGKDTLSGALPTTAFPLLVTRAHKGTTPTERCGGLDLLCSRGALWICLRLMPPLWWPFKKEPIPKGQEKFDGFWDLWQLSALELKPARAGIFRDLRWPNTSFLLSTIL